MLIDYVFFFPAVRTCFVSDLQRGLKIQEAKFNLDGTAEVKCCFYSRFYASCHSLSLSVNLFALSNALMYIYLHFFLLANVFLASSPSSRC